MLIRIALFFLCLSSVCFAATEREADHEKLRGLLKQVTSAVNALDFEMLSKSFADRFTFVTVDQKAFHTIPDLKAHFEQTFRGDKAVLKKIEFNPKADALTEFVGDSLGLSLGSSEDIYHFSDGETRTMKSRWSATVVKAGEDWKILALHMGADILANPAMEAAKAVALRLAIFAALGGLIVGAVGAYLALRKSPRAA